MGAAPSRSDSHYRDRYHGTHRRRRTYTNSSPYSTLSRGTLSSRGTPLLPYPYNLHPNAPIAPGGVGVQVPAQLPYLFPGVTSAYVYNHQTKQFIPVLVPQPGGAPQNNVLPQGAVQPVVVQPSVQPIDQFPQPQVPPQPIVAPTQPIIPFPQPQIPSTNVPQASIPTAAVTFPQPQIPSTNVPQAFVPAGTVTFPQPEVINPLPTAPVIPAMTNTAIPSPLPPQQNLNPTSIPSVVPPSQPTASPRMPEPVVMPSTSVRPETLDYDFPSVIPPFPTDIPEDSPPTPVRPFLPPNPNSNPLPEPPAAIPIPDHLLSGTAVVLPGAPGPHAHGRSHSEPYPSSSGTSNAHLPPLKYPLPPPPKDVYDLPAYRELTRGVMAKEVYPDGWFNGKEKEPSTHKHQGAGIGRRITKRLKKIENALVKTFGSPERDYAHATPMLRSGSVLSPRLQAHGQPNGSVRAPSVQRSQTFGGFTPRDLQGNGAPLPPQPQPIVIQQAIPPAPILSNGTPVGNSAVQPLATQSQQSHLTTPTAQMPQPTPVAFSPPIHFNSTTHPWLALHSPHTIVYREKLYPTSLHLFEAFKFIGRRDDIARHIRHTEHPQGVPAIVNPIWDEESESVRRDWGTIVRDKMDEVLYLKFTQHSDLRRLLLETGFADLIYSEPTDKFWGTTNGHGGNELGKALIRVRDRLRREGGGR